MTRPGESRRTSPAESDSLRPVTLQPTQFVYAIDLGDGRIKIGISCNPGRRLGELLLKRFSPKLLMAVSSPDPKADERILHYLLRDYVAAGIQGECFAIPAALACQFLVELPEIRKIAIVPADFSLLRLRRALKYAK